MSQVELPFGDDHLRCSVPDDQLLGVVLPAEGGDDHGDECFLLREALAHPIGSAPLRHRRRPPACLRRRCARLRPSHHRHRGAPGRTIRAHGRY